MWIPMMMPVVEVLLFCSSFMQSQGGFSTARKKEERGSVVLFASWSSSFWGAQGKSGTLGHKQGKRIAAWGPGWVTKAAPLLLVPQQSGPSKHRTGRSIESQPHYPGCCYYMLLMNKNKSDVNFYKPLCLR